ncbi:zinc ribbon domain-containing protein [uncultured Methanobrevibacter sp.]|uniref:zinc ribbon domain-containing protein n=1 Tax=uncultured Methanobrevibacter sp. TaxID=253161 RepID=UPI0025DD6A1B|nr:zinc ribbon domain-containing protein [uncultured Methanobrevibacter sp.]
MRCYNCGFENKDGVTFCHNCGVNLKTFDDNADDLNNKYNVQRKRQPHSPISLDSIQTKLLYKYDKNTGRLRFAKTKSISLIVFCAFTGFGFIVYPAIVGIVPTIIIAPILGIVFTLPVAIIGYVLGLVIDKIFH